MKRLTQFVLASAVVLALVCPAVAQDQPEQVIRLGDWVEVADDFFLNFIGLVDVRYRTSHNFEFENRLQDRMATSLIADSSHNAAEGDLMFYEVRWGADFRYKKNLDGRLLFRMGQALDGVLVDGLHFLDTPADPAQFDDDGTGACLDDNDLREFTPGATVGAAPTLGQCRSESVIGNSSEDTGVHIARAWIGYNIPNTPIRMRVGSWIWLWDAAGILGDDDPGIEFSAKFGANEEWEVAAMAVVQFEGSRLALTNDNDYIYYPFRVAYTWGAHRFGLEGAYHRDRHSPRSPLCCGGIGNQASGSADPNDEPNPIQIRKQTQDAVLLMPNWTGSFGPISGILEALIMVGTADGVDGTDYDIFSYGFVGAFEANLGIVRPFVGFLYGSGDDDPTDTDLEGFNHFTQPFGDISLWAARQQFDAFIPSFVFEWGPAAPARARVFGGNLGRHTITNPWMDRVGVNAHRDPVTGNAKITTPLSNPGTLLIPAGVKFFPFPGHRFDLGYIYVRLLEPELVEAEILTIFGDTVEIDESLHHELYVTWYWTPNPYFDVRLSGKMAIPARGTKDIAETVTCPDGTPCDGDDLALQAEIRFRVRF